MIYLMLLCGFLSFHLAESERCADLIVSEISEPEWDHDNRTTIVRATIKNIGKLKSPAVMAKVYDLDISADEAKERGLQDFLIEAIEENNARARYYKEKGTWLSEEEMAQVDSFDYDFNVEAIAKVPSLKAGEKIEVIFKIKDHWIYDSNCEIEIWVDFENKLEECEEGNNKKAFFAWG